jgi:probable rRNA maturation factor
LFDGPLPAQVDVVVIGMEEHCRLHEEFLSDPTPTDVMAFPYADKDLFGEIIVNSDMALLQAPLQKQSALAEMTLYIVHGALHLLGFDDTSVPSREKMRAAEQKVVEKLRKQI